MIDILSLAGMLFGGGEEEKWGGGKGEEEGEEEIGRASCRERV